MGTELVALARAALIVGADDDVPGYDRECRRGHACVFGPAWTDDSLAPGGHNGCDTRDDLLATTLKHVTYRPGTHNCVVLSGSFIDPYTAQQLTFSKAEAAKVQLDHIYPLKAAWSRGAATWTLTQRKTFANDPANLVVTSGRVNASKGDRTPGEWLPINRTYRCRYVLRFLQVASDYHLPISPADRDSALTLAPSCS